MLDFFKYIFSNVWYFFGFTIIFSLFIEGIVQLSRIIFSGIVLAIKGHKADNYYYLGKSGRKRIQKPEDILEEEEKELREDS